MLRIVTSRLVPPTGHILINGEKRNYDSFRQMSAYVLQQDLLFPELTVLETVTLSALLRLPGKMKKEEKLSRVQAIIHELGRWFIINMHFGTTEIDLARY